MHVCLKKCLSLQRSHSQLLACAKRASDTASQIGQAPDSNFMLQRSSTQPHNKHRKPRQHLFCCVDDKRVHLFQNLSSPLCNSVSLYSPPSELSGNYIYFYNLSKSCTASWSELCLLYFCVEKTGQSFKLLGLWASENRGPSSVIQFPLQFIQTFSFDSVNAKPVRSVSERSSVYRNRFNKWSHLRFIAWGEKHLVWGTASKEVSAMLLRTHECFLEMIALPDTAFIFAPLLTAIMQPALLRFFISHTNVTCSWCIHTKARRQHIREH